MYLFAYLRLIRTLAQLKLGGAMLEISGCLVVCISVQRVVMQCMVSGLG